MSSTLWNMQIGTNLSKHFSLHGSESQTKTSGICILFNGLKVNGQHTSKLSMQENLDGYISFPPYMVVYSTSLISVFLGALTIHGNV